MKNKFSQPPREAQKPQKGRRLAVLPLAARAKSPLAVRTHPKGSAALLIDYQRASQDAVHSAVAAALPKLRALPGMITMSDFSTTPESHARLWRVREDLFAIVGGARRPRSE